MDLDHIEVRLLGAGVAILTARPGLRLGVLVAGHRHGGPCQARGDGRRLDRLRRGVRAAGSPGGCLPGGSPGPASPSSRPRSSPSRRSTGAATRGPRRPPSGPRHERALPLRHRRVPPQRAARGPGEAGPGLRGRAPGGPGRACPASGSSRCSTRATASSSTAWAPTGRRRSSVQAAYCARQRFDAAEFERIRLQAHGPRRRAPPLRGRERARLPAARRERDLRPGEGGLCRRPGPRLDRRGAQPRLPEGVPGGQARAHPHRASRPGG